MAENNEHESIYTIPTRRYIKKITSVIGDYTRSKKSVPANQFEKNLRDMIVLAVNESREKNQTGEEAIEILNGISITNNTWQKKYQELRTAYDITYTDRQALIDEKKQIGEIEHSTLQRNTFYRAITTLVVGFSIMAVYWVAHYFGIPMPLMRVPL